MFKITINTNTYGPPKTGRIFDAQIELNNQVDKSAVCIQKSGKIIGHLKKWATGRFAKI